MRTQVSSSTSWTRDQDVRSEVESGSASGSDFRVPDLRFKPAPASKTEIPRPKRGEGQWGLGYTEPLNKNEQSKKDDDPLNVRDRILYVYSKRGFDSIDPADLRGRFRWMGLYTQRKPGIDGGKTATLEEEELDDRFFMMRVRTDGQLLSHDAVRALGTIGRDFGRDTADVTDRENIQYHWIEVENVPEIWERLEAAGLSTLEPAATPRARSSAPPSPVSRSTRSSTAPRRSTRSSVGTWATRPSRTSRGSSRPRSPVTRATTSRRRPTMSHSSGRSTPSTVPASTSGSAVACPPTRT